MKKFLASVLAVILLITAVAMVACGPEQPEPKPVAFKGEYETLTSGYIDTYTFEGETTNDIITALTFEVERVKADGSGEPYDKKDIDGYDMNISDLVITEADGVYTLAQWNSYGYGTGYFMQDAVSQVIDDATTFGDLSFKQYGQPITTEVALTAFASPANELKLEGLSADTLLKDFFALYGGYKDGSYVAIDTRISFDGPAGGRSYGEQIDAMVTHILANDMTLEEVYTLFSTTNQNDVAIEDRTQVAGATIAFTAALKNVVYNAIHGEIFQGVTSHSVKDGNTTIMVTVQGFGGEILVNFTYNAEDKLTGVKVGTNQETVAVAGDHLQSDGDFIKALIADGEDATTMTGATVTTTAMLKALELANDYLATL